MPNLRPAGELLATCHRKGHMQTTVKNSQTKSYCQQSWNNFVKAIETKILIKKEETMLWYEIDNRVFAIPSMSKYVFVQKTNFFFLNLEFEIYYSLAVFFLKKIIEVDVRSKFCSFPFQISRREYGKCRWSLSTT
jgi:hypothetical protein